MIVTSIPDRLSGIGLFIPGPLVLLSDESKTSLTQTEDSDPSSKHQLPVSNCRQCLSVSLCRGCDVCCRRGWYQAIRAPYAGR